MNKLNFSGLRVLVTGGAGGIGAVICRRLHAMGAEVTGLSLITNLAAGIGDAALSHDEVVEAGRQAAGELEALVTEFCGRL